MAHGLILTCSLIDRESFMHLRSWLNSVKEAVDTSKIPIILVGNKCDLVDERQVSHQEIKERADDLNLPYFETSALNNIGISEAFDTIFSKVFESVYNQKSGFELGENGNSNEVKEHKCCLR